jgi:hypothetical protein
MIQTPPVQWQFGLRQLFGFLTLVAMAAALVAAFGPRTLLASAGILIAWFSACGAFRGVQSGKRQELILATAWALFLLSLYLPVARVPGDFYGWQAAFVCLCNPSCFPSTAANILMALMPVIVWRTDAGRGEWLRIALCVAMPASWSFCWFAREQWYSGYWVWCASFLVALFALPVRPWMLPLMMIVAGSAGMSFWPARP